MASAAPTSPSTKETTNYARLCRLLVAVGSQVLRDTFDKIHPPGSLGTVLSSSSVHCTLKSLRKKRVLTPLQWDRLYPMDKTSVSSQGFDITLLMVLLRSISGLAPPATGWDKLPPQADKTLEADIVRLKYHRNTVYGHASETSVDDATFNQYWIDIEDALVILGGKKYQNTIDDLRNECMDPDLEVHYQELLEQWVLEEVRIKKSYFESEENFGQDDLIVEETMVNLEKTMGVKGTLKDLCNSAPVEPAVVIKGTHSTLRTRLAPVISAVHRIRDNLLTRLSPRSESYAEEVRSDQEIVSPLAFTKKNSHRIQSEGLISVQKQNETVDAVVRKLEKAIDCHQSDCIVLARQSLKVLVDAMSSVPPKDLKFPTRHGWEVLNRGKKLFLEEGVSCSIKHGTLLLDSSEHGGQFFFGLLNVVGAFALLISELEIAKEIFDLLFNLHRTSATTSRSQELGAACNNKACMFMIMGDLREAEGAFKTSLRHFNHLDSSSNETRVIAVKSNISRLHLISRNFLEALEQQEQLVNKCKATKMKEIPYAFQTVFTIMNNQAVLHTTLGTFNKAEHGLKWLISYCNEMERKDCDHLVNFVYLHLSEVLLLHGKSKEAEEGFSLEELSSKSFEDLVDMFGGLYMNVRIEAFEKLVEVFIRRGKIRIALELLQKAVKIIKEVFGPDHLNVASLLYKQGMILSLTGDVSSAAEKFKFSADILQTIFGLKNPLLLKCYMSLGELTSTLKHTEESHLYFQRATESIEALYQVSFVSELSITYMEITKTSRKFRRSGMLKGRIEGLVAEHGQAFAILLLQDNNRHLKRCRTYGKQLLTTERSQCSDSMVIISLKYTRDFLQTGQKLLRQGMKNEAIAFFEQAGAHSEVHNLTQGNPNVDLARLHNILIKKHSEALGDDRDLNNFLNQLSKDMEEKEKESSVKQTTDVAATMEFDYQFSFKLLLMFLILLSIELKMIDTTFAAYDLYSKLSQNDNEFFFLVNEGIQVYASKTFITCNGETAVQDILISSGIGLNESDTECPALDEQLFRSLCYKKNAPTNAFLVTSSIPVSLDIDDLHSIEEKTSLAVQECFQMKCFETETKGSTTQLVVDLTSTMATCGYNDILSTGSRIELLPLCLSEDPNAGVFHKGTIFEINNAMYQKITRVTFEDEQTSCFIFNKTALRLLQQGNSENVSTMALPSHSLSLMVFHPVKARLTLSRSEKWITQKIQFVTTETTELGEKSCPHSVPDAFSWQGIDQMVEKYQVPCKKRIYSKEPLDNSVAHCKSNASLMREWPPTVRSSEVYSEGHSAISELHDSHEIPRNSLKGSVLDCLETVSELSRLLNTETVQGDDDISLGDLTEGDTRCVATTSQSQVDRGTISSTFQQSTPNPEVDEKSQYPTLYAPGCITVEANPCAHEKESMLREEDEILTGKRLFEDDRKSRRSFMADLQGSLKKKELNFKEGASIDSNRGDTNHMSSLHSSQTHNDSSNSNLELQNLDPETQKQSENPHIRNVSSLANKTKPGSHEGDTVTTDDGNAVGVRQLERDELSRDPVINKIQDPNNVELQAKSNILEDRNSPLSNTTLEEEDPVTASQESESTSALGRETRGKIIETVTNYVNSTKIARDGKQNVMETTTETFVPKLEVEDAIGVDKSQPETSSSANLKAHCRQQHCNLQEVRTNPDTNKKERTKGPSSERRDREEVREVGEARVKTLENKHTSHSNSRSDAMKERTFGPLAEDVLPDESVKGQLNRSQNNESEVLRETDVANGPNLKEESGKCSSYNPSKAIGLTNTDREISLKPRARIPHRTETTSRSMYLGGDVVADGDSSEESLQKDNDVVDGPILAQGSPREIQAIHASEAFKAIISQDSVTKRDEIKSFKTRNAIDDSGYPPTGHGGARPKQRSAEYVQNLRAKSSVNDLMPTNQYDQRRSPGLDPIFVARHINDGSPLHWFSNGGNYNQAALEAPPWDVYDQYYFSSEGRENLLNDGEQKSQRKECSQLSCTSSGNCTYLPPKYILAPRSSNKRQMSPLNPNESWYFSPPVSNGDSVLLQSQCFVDGRNEGYSTEFEDPLASSLKALFSSRESRAAYNDMESMANEYCSSTENVDCRPVQSPKISEDQQSSTEHSSPSLIESLQQVMAKTVQLIASSTTAAEEPQHNLQSVEKIGIQEEARDIREREPAVTAIIDESRDREESTQTNEPTLETERHSIATPVQESPRPVCSHYQRRCLVRFPCCETYYPCHRCHNESGCSEDQARAINATHIRCTICYHEQAIDQESQKCGGCKAKMSEYFCAICKHFTSVDKNPFHCEKCGICRIHRDRSFHCDVCNVCLDKRLQGKHKCRPDSGHDECCICLEDAFSGCQILPCSHKVHKDCAIAMIQNGVRTCPICRHPLFAQLQNSPQ